MSRSLPPRPSLLQLKHQAKDILKAQRSGDASVCETLRRLDRFAGASDGDILTAGLALNEVQFALAMEYGFESWNAMKLHAEAAHADITARARLERSDGKAVITGLERVDWGGSFYRRDNSFMRALSAALNAIGEDVTYEYLMGVSGAAFRLQVAQPRWCPSAACTPCGFDCAPPALAAVGYPMEFIDIHDKDPSKIDRARRVVVESINKGRPALYNSEETSIIVGHRDDGLVFVLRHYFSSGSPGYEETRELPWGLSVLGEKGPVPDRMETLTGALGRAVMLARTPKFGNYASGFAAYEAWIRDLRGAFDSPEAEPWEGAMHCNAHTYATLFNARAAAAEFLHEITAEFDSAASAHLKTAAALYDRIQQSLLASRQCVAYPWVWSAERREAQAGILQDVMEQERQAVAEIEKALSAGGGD